MQESADNGLDSAAARLPRWMAGVAVAGAMVALAGGRARFAAGFAVGSVVAILAYWWLHQAVATALNSAEARPARTMMLKFAMRYPLLLIVVVLCYQTGWLPLRGVIAGLFVPLAGALIECVVFLARSLRNGWPPASAEIGPSDTPPPAELHT